MKEPRQQLKTYLEAGDFPTEKEFSNILDSIVHKDELIPELFIKRGKSHNIFNYINPSGVPATGRAYHLNIELKGDIDFDSLKPKLIIYRYKPKRYKSREVIKPAGWYHENPKEAEINGRISEVYLTANESSIDIKPQNYFKADADGKYYPTGYQIGGGKWVKKKKKIYIYLQLRVLIHLEGQEILSKPKTVRLLHEWHNMYTYELINV